MAKDEQTIYSAISSDACQDTEQYKPKRTQSMCMMILKLCAGKRSNAFTRGALQWYQFIFLSSLRKVNWMHCNDHLPPRTVARNAKVTASFNREQSPDHTYLYVKEPGKAGRAEREKKKR